MKRRHARRRHKTDTSRSAPKVSQTVWEFAGTFIGSGQTLEDRQDRLTAACSAWNMACTPPEAHERLLRQYVESCRSYSPDATDEKLSDVRRVMEKLMRNKLALFPTVRKQIVGAQLSRAAGKDRIDVVSATFI